MTLPANTTSVVAYMKHEGGTEVYFDDLKIELNAVPTALVVQENHYYPFGMGMKGLDYTAPSPNRENKFTFNGKEKQTELGLHQYDFHARNYDYQINRTTTLDPLAFINDDISGYSFLDNNPINTIDPTGMDGESILPQGTAYDQQKERDRKEMQNLTRNYRTVSYLWRNTPDNGTLQASNNGDGTLNVYFMESFASQESGNPSLMNDWHSITGLWHISKLKLPSYYNPIANAVRGGRDGYSSDSFHDGVGLFGFVPIVGDLADIMDAGVYASEGNYTQASLSLVAAIPVVGSFIKAGLKQIVTSGARKVMNHAVTNPIYMSRLNPNLASHVGTAIHLSFMNNYRISKRLSLAVYLDLVRLTPQGSTGADIIGQGILRGTWWDVTTQRQWQKHLDKYADPNSSKYIRTDAVPLLYR